MFLSRMPSGEPEVFASVQGEGATTGLPSVFVRLSLCNLSCGWCDSAYTWDWTRYDSRTEKMSLGVEEVCARVLERAGDSIRNVVLTGGEPLLQEGEVAVLAARLKAEGFRLEVETNGTRLPGRELRRTIDQWNVSPKLANSGDPRHKREVPRALAWFGPRANAYWKFVVTRPDDLHEVTDLVERYGVPGDRVFLMPEGTDPTTLSERSEWLAAICQETGYRLGTRLQVYLWGAERGR